MPTIQRINFLIDGIVLSVDQPAVNQTGVLGIVIVHAPPTGGRKVH